MIRDRNALFRELPNDIIENIYTLKIINQSNEPREFVLEVSGVEGIALDGVDAPISVDGGAVLSLPVRARIHRDNSYGIMAIDFTATAVDDSSVSVIEDSRFLGPSP